MIYLDYPSISPILLSVGSFDIRWYSLAYILGFLFSWQYIKYLSSSNKLYNFDNSLKNQAIDDLIFYSILFLIIGARLGYVIFYNGTYYLENPLHIFYIWQGGLSFHGGLLGVILAVYYIKTLNKINFYIISDLICASAPVGLFLGRISNFINGELYGRPASSLIGMIFPSADSQYRHPSQLYEAFLEGICLFILLNILIFGFKKLSKPGYISSFFLIFYGMFRFIVEVRREPDVQIGFVYKFLTMGMILSIPMIIIGFIILITSQFKNDPKK